VSVALIWNINKQPAPRNYHTISLMLSILHLPFVVILCLRRRAHLSWRAYRTHDRSLQIFFFKSMLFSSFN